MKRVIAALAFLACVGSAQAQQNSIFQRVFNSVGWTGAVASAPMRNIGQQYSILSVSVANTTPGSCPSGWVGAIQLEASYDNASYFQIGTPITVIPTVGVFQSTSAPGSYSFIRVNYLQGDGNCALTAYYSGSITGTPIGSAPYSTFGEQFRVESFSPVSAPQSLVRCSPGRMVVYGLVASNLVATANGGTFTITNDSTSTTTFSVGFAVAPSASYILPNGPRPYFRDNIDHTGSLSTDIETLNLSALTAATNMSFLIVYRCE